MSINSALAAGASGLLANSFALAAISDNIANVNTVGYKRVATTFSANYETTKGAGDARYAAGGVSSLSSLDISTEGLLNPANSATDLAVRGKGFFVVRPNASAGVADAVYFTRAGSFETDNSGYLKNNAGMYLYGWPVSSDGSVPVNPSNVSLLEAVNLSNIGGAAEATSRVRVNANLSSGTTISAAATGAPATYDPTNSALNMASGNVAPDIVVPLEVYDTQGGVRTVNLSLLKSATANQWYAELHITPATDAVTGANLVDGQIATGTIAFDTNGQIDTTNTTLPNSFTIQGSDFAGPLGANQVQWAPATGIGSQTVSLDLGAAGAPGGITQYNSPTNIGSTIINGAVFGSFEGVEVSSDGFVSARFSNGVVRQIYQVPLASVVNPDGMASVGAGSFAVTPESGAFTLNVPGSGSSGSVSAQTLENSNVDIATEFSNLIITQRAYSAASRIITTADEMLAEAIQLKR
ncbi:flagellar hook protein FlgE [Woodsholea maritima]|uniref:flagellar hook protein FlgE n=1 Tax=Woodsholea maritima TaxID=240237 RepID=UPI00035C6BA9|nr:flagellar hook-basal body complex protein [Woodsholea maritima]